MGKKSLLTITLFEFGRSEGLERVGAELGPNQVEVVLCDHVEHDRQSEGLRRCERSPSS